MESCLPRSHNNDVDVQRLIANCLGRSLSSDLYGGLSRYPTIVLWTPRVVVTWDTEELQLVTRTQLFISRRHDTPLKMIQ